ncbi:MAG: hypothetical protein M0O96_10140 [Desulforhopalus sp.]|nr:hypothetical protein [Desulforhopalus sp.]
MSPPLSNIKALPLGSTAIIDLEGKHWALNGGHLVALENINDADGPKWIFTDFERAFKHVESVASEKRYAAPILEKKLRDRGDTDGVSKVLLIAARTTAKTTSVLYTAVATECFSSYWTMAARQKDHCLLIPMLSVLYRYALSTSCQNVAVLLQYGLNFDVLLLSKGSPISCISVTSSGPEPDDWERALHYLASEIQKVTSAMKPSLPEIRWFSWDPEGTTQGQGLANKLQDILEIPVQQSEEYRLILKGKSFQTSLPALLDHARASDQVSGGSSKILYLSERLMPWAAALVLGLSCALFAASHYWQDAARQNEQQAAHFRQQINVDEIAGISEQVARKQQHLQASEEQTEFSFVSHLHKTLLLPSLPEIIGDIRTATPAAIKVSGITLVPDQENSQIIIDGQIDKDLQAVNNDVDFFISGLRARGYNVRDKGLLAKDRSNLFQIVLTLNGAQHEI